MSDKFKTLAQEWIDKTNAEADYLGRVEVEDLAELLVKVDQDARVQCAQIAEEAYPIKLSTSTLKSKKPSPQEARTMAVKTYDWHFRAVCPCGAHRAVWRGDVWFLHGPCPKCGRRKTDAQVKTMRRCSDGPFWNRRQWWETQDA